MTLEEKGNCHSLTSRTLRGTFIVPSIVFSEQNRQQNDQKVLNGTTSSSTMISIGLGTSFSCIHIFDQNSIDIIANNMGDRTTSSCAPFTENAQCVRAIDMDAILDVKRMIVRNFSYPIVLADILRWPFKVICHDTDLPHHELQWKNETKRFYPAELSARVLSKMKEVETNAEYYFGQGV
jgi:L1 cell adhesion molecule like protein